MLNEHQKRGLSVTLRILEESMNDIEEILNKKTYIGILYDVKCNIPSEIREVILKKVALVKERIKIISNTFHLNKESRGGVKEISSKLSSCLEILDNVKTKRLDRYGKVSNELPNVLDPQLDVITNLILEIDRVLVGTPK